MTTTHQSDVAAALEFAAENFPDDTYEHDGNLYVRVRNDEHLDKLEPWRSQPQRSKGTIHVHDSTSFTTAVLQRAGTDPDFPAVLYADIPSNDLVAVLNDDYASEPGYRDYRVKLMLASTPEWRHWASRSGQGMKQTDFAEHILEGMDEIVSPSSADLLEIAQRFEATTNATFKSGVRLANGQVQFVYEEEVNATAGQLAIPDEFTLMLVPFVGSVPRQITARLRYRLNKGELALSYHLVKPHVVEAEAFAGVVADVEAALETTALRGPAPA